MDYQAILSAERRADLSARGLWLNRLFSDALDEVAARTPDALAIVDHNSMTGASTRMSYAELQRLSVRIACALAAQGVQRDDVVAVQLPNWWHYAAVYIACVRIGAVINPLMPVFRERELEYMLGFAEAKVWIVPREFRGFDYPAMAASLRGVLPKLEKVFVVGGTDSATSFEACLVERAWEAEADSAALFAARRMQPNDVTEIMYTSGTTGQPKGVMHTANTLMCKCLLASELFGFSEHDAIFMGSPLAHQTGFLYGALFSIYHGTPCVMQDVWEPVKASRLMAEERCTITLGATPFLSDLVRTEAAKAFDTSCLRLFLCSGAPIPRVLVEDANASHPNMYVMSAWGMTEMGITTATYPGDPLEKVLDSDGRALPHQAVRVLDEAGALVAPGIEGRLQARCATTFVGYLKRPEAYGVDADGWIETGDNARMDADGYIRITGRSKDIIIRGGENIPVVEVEALLYRHPAVEDAAVVAMPDARLGERGCAFVTLRAGHSLDFRGMIAYLNDCRMMKQYLPERLEIIAAFPRTPSGKIQKFKLREQARSLTPMSLAP
ncbi:MAG: AMP-binding protein [Gammaproteobacteria bacterium]|nr:AMP-binding protein [Gammaproteobacteria bacterium]